MLRAVRISRAAWNDWAALVKAAVALTERLPSPARERIIARLRHAERHGPQAYLVEIHRTLYRIYGSDRWERWREELRDMERALGRVIGWDRRRR